MIESTDATARGVKLARSIGEPFLRVLAEQDILAMLEQHRLYRLPELAHPPAEFARRLLQRSALHRHIGCREARRDLSPAETEQRADPRKRMRQRVLHR